MTDLVLARKYRPRSFEQMVGQEHVVQALSNALASGRLHHAYLFTGTRGIGKTTVSRILAKSLNCTGADGSGGVTALPCGVCQACTEIDADRFIDYIELDAASNRSIDEIRELIERAAYKPSVGRYKVFMIDEAHQLTKDAFNALLKTLEEPPAYLKFVLATTDPDKMLPTVLSRCLQFNLRPMAPEVVQAHLLEVLQAESVDADAGALRLLARAARGSMRDALSLTDQAIAYGGGRLDEAGVRAMLGAVDRRHAARLVQALAERDGASVLEVVDVLRRQGLSASGTLEEVAMLLQQMAVEQAVPGALDDGDPDTAGARQLAAQMPADETQLLYSIAVHGRSEIHVLADEYAALTMVLLRLLAFPPTGPAPAAVARHAPLVVAPRQARSSIQAAQAAGLRAAPAPVRAADAVPPKRVVAADAAAQTPATPTDTAAASNAAPGSAEPPPWLDEPPPEEGFAAAAVPRVIESAPAGPVLPARTRLGDRWHDAVQKLVANGSIGALVRELAHQAELTAIEVVDAVECWCLRVERETLRADALRGKLQAALTELEQRSLRVCVEPGVAADSPALREAVAREQAQVEAERLIRGDPEVRELLGQFSTARIVPGSIKPIHEPRNDTP